MSTFYDKNFVLFSYLLYYNNFTRTNKLKGVFYMIRKYRQLKKLSQEELAEEINISWRQLQRIEQNEEKTRITTFKKIVKVLNIPDNEIIEFLKK